MILRMLILVLTLSSSLTSTLFASTDRGDRVVSETGGAAGVAGVAGPAGAPGIAGAAGQQGIQGLPGIPSAPGILDFSDFYALQDLVTPVDNPLPIAMNSPVLFPRNGSSNGVITRLTDSSFNLPTIGTYLVMFQLSVTENAQFALRLNSGLIANSVVGRATGTDQLLGMSIVTTSIVNSVLEVISVGNVAGKTITANAGGTAPVSAHLVILRIQ